MKHIPRRDFFRSALALGSVLPMTAVAKAPSVTVVEAVSAAVRNANRSILADGVSRLLDMAMEAFFEVEAVSAWRACVKPTDVVGLKVNALAGRGLSTHVELVEAICERLQQAGVRADHIIIWDRMNRDLERAGFKIVTTGKGPLCYGNDVSGYSDAIFEFGLAGSRISRIVTDRCTALINVPILKDHGIVGASVGMKNFFGAIDNPNKYHDANGDPYVADVNMFAPILSKHRLTICDALTAQYEGGPPFMAQWCWAMNTLLVSRDMVAMDRIGWEILEEKRKQMKLPSLKQVGREPTYILTAADSQHRLGIAERSRINLVRCSR